MGECGRARVPVIYFEFTYVADVVNKLIMQLTASLSIRADIIWAIWTIN